MSINSTSAYWSMMQKVERGDYEIVFRKINKPNMFDGGCGRPFWPITNTCGLMLNFGPTSTQTTTSWWTYEHSHYDIKKTPCASCGKWIDAMYCYKCMTKEPVWNVEISGFKWRREP